MHTIEPRLNQYIDPRLKEAIKEVGVQMFLLCGKCFHCIVTPHWSAAQALSQWSNTEPLQCETSSTRWQPTAVEHTHLQHGSPGQCAATAGCSCIQDSYLHHQILHQICRKTAATTKTLGTTFMKETRVLSWLRRFLEQSHTPLLFLLFSFYCQYPFPSLHHIFQQLCLFPAEGN